MAFDVLGILAPHPPVMVPEVGGGRADVTEASARSMRIAAEMLRRFDPETIIVMSPHAVLARDGFVVDSARYTTGDLGDFGAPQVAVSTAGDPKLAEAILEAAAEAGIPAIDRALSPITTPGALDHGVVVPMSFLDREGRWPLLVVSLSFLPLGQHRSFGAAIARAVDKLGRRVAFVASGDTSHRLTPDAPAGYSPRAREFDERLLELLSANDYAGLVTIEPRLVGEAGECGLRSFTALGGFLEWTDATTRVLSYEAPWGVGYLTAVATDPEGMRVLDEVESREPKATPATGRKGGTPGHDESEPTKLARQAIEAYVSRAEVVEPPTQLSELMRSQAGAFVSLHRDDSLRGCIGTICPTQDNLAQEIIRNAIEAATGDPRFPAVGRDELADLDIKVDVLGTAQACEMHELDPKEYGVIVTADRRRGLLLPDLEGVSSVEQQVSIAAAKAGIEPGERVGLERFKVDRYT